MENESISRKLALHAELKERCRNELLWARWNHGMSLLFMGVALGCGVLAGVLGFFTTVSSKVVGGIAVIPTLTAYVAVNLKFELKNSWHARLYDGLNTLRSRLMYQLPEVPTLEQVARIASDRDELEIKMQAEWDRSLLVNWTGLSTKHLPGDPPDESSGGALISR
jgi:hypothetical protein